MAGAPIVGKCKTRLLAAHAAEWVTGLHAAMLRDTLDGLLSIDADRYLVFGAPDEGNTALDVLARHVPAPWEIVAQEGGDLGARMEHALGAMFASGATYAILSGTDSPSLPTEPLDAALADAGTHASVIAGPTEDGGYYAIGMPRVVPELLRNVPWSTPAVMETTRLRCKSAGLALHELPKWYDVDEPSDVLALMEELRKHPERAPRTAHFMVTAG